MGCAVIYILLASLLSTIVVTEGRASRDRKSKEVEPDPASKFLGMLKHHQRINQKKQHTTVNPPSYNKTTTTTLRDVVYMRFQKELKRLFAVLPADEKCKHLNAFSRTIRCNATRVNNILVGFAVLNGITPCPDKGASRVSGCMLHNKTAMVELFWMKLARLFSDNITVPFQCNIINSIASGNQFTDKKDTNTRRRHLTLKKVELILENIFPFLNVRQKCSKVWKPLKKRVPLQMPSSLLNVTVRLHRGRGRKSWLRNLRKKAQQIYKIYLEYHKKSKKQRPLIPQKSSSSITAAYNRVRLSVIRVTKFNGTVSVIFKLEVSDRRTFQFKRVSQAKTVADALQSKGKAFLDNLFNAKVLRIARAQKKQSTHKYVMRHSDIAKLTQLFPESLKGYYKQLSTLERCLIMLYISSMVNTELRQTELLYNTYKYIPRKYFCSSRSRISASNPIINQKQTYRSKGPATPKRYKDVSPSAKPGPTTGNMFLDTSNNHTFAQTNPDDEDVPDEDYSDEKKGITSLEIVLFILLGLLCVAILVFTINCVMFALKPKSADINGSQPNTAFARALFRRVPTNDSPRDQVDQECVDVTVNRCDNPELLRTLLERRKCDDDNALPCVNSPHEHCEIQCRDSCNPENHRLMRRGISDSSENIDRTYTSTADDTELKCTSDHNLEADNLEQMCSCNHKRSDLSLDGHCPSTKSERSSSLNSRTSFDDRHRSPIKEGSGELKIVCESESNSSESLEQNGGIRTSNCKVMVVLDQTGEKEEQL